MSYSVTNLKSDLTGMLHGTTLSQISGVNNLIDRAAREVLLDVDPAETKRTVEISTPIFDDIWDYAVPADLKGNRVIDIKPNSFRFPSDRMSQSYNKDFDINKNFLDSNSAFTIVHNTGVKTIRIDDNNQIKGITLDTADTDQGWTAVSTASNLKTDNVNFISGSGSISFDLAAGANPSTGTINKTLASQLDMTDHLNQSSLFYYVWFPTASDITSVELQWGSDSSNYYSRTATVTSEGNSFADGWNLIRAEWLGATVTGTPVVTAIDFVQVGVTYNGTAQTAVRVDNIVSNLGRIMEIEYYSKFLFRDSTTGGFQETVADDSDLINLDTESYNLLTYKAGILAAQQQQGVSAVNFDVPFFEQRYATALKRYRAMYKNEVTKPTNAYYKMNKGGYSRFLGRRF